MVKPIFHDYKEAFSDEFGREKSVRLELSEKQRRFIHRMYRKVYGLSDDQKVCAFPVEKDDGFGGTRLYMHGIQEKVNIHHIMPKGFAFYVLGWSPEEINSPYNLIPICQHHHTTEKGNRHREGDWDLLHPDMVEAFTTYDGTKDSFRKVFDKRDDLMRIYEMYHNPDFDQLLLEKAQYTYDMYMQMQLEEFGHYVDIYPDRRYTIKIRP